MKCLGMRSGLQALFEDSQWISRLEVQRKFHQLAASPEKSLACVPSGSKAEQGFEKVGLNWSKFGLVSQHWCLKPDSESYRKPECGDVEELINVFRSQAALFLIPLTSLNSSVLASILPSIFWTTYPTRGHKKPGGYPRDFREECRKHPGWGASMSQGTTAHKLTHTLWTVLLSLQRMFLEWRNKPENKDKHAIGENKSHAYSVEAGNEPPTSGGVKQACLQLSQSVP